MSAPKDEKFQFSIDVVEVIQDGENVIVIYNIEGVSGRQETSFPLSPFMEGRIPLDEEQLESMIRERADPIFRRNRESIAIKTQAAEVVSSLKQILEGQTFVKKGVEKELPSEDLPPKDLPKPDSEEEPQP